MGIIILFYKYIAIRYPKQLQKWQKRICEERGITGRIIIASEGINGTLGGTAEAIEHYCALLRSHELFHDIDIKESAGSSADFPRLSVVVRSEIVSLGIAPEMLPASQAGRHLTPQQAHALLQSAQSSRAASDLVVLDGRNNYESAVGSFVGAVTPPIEHFRDFPNYIDEHLELFRGKTVLMYCTGGVRCERASAYLKQKQVAREVLQIAGGIHRYIEQYPHGFFKGKNYVFDKRVAVTVTDDLLGSCVRCNLSSDRLQGCSDSSCKRQLIVCGLCAVHAVYCASHTAAVNQPHETPHLEV